MDASDTRIKIRVDLVESNLVVCLAGRPIHDKAYRGILDAQLARQGRFRHAGHTHEVTAVTLETLDFSRSLESRPLRAGLDAAIR